MIGDEPCTGDLTYKEYAEFYGDAEHAHWLLGELVAARRRAGLTQAEVADRMGVTQSTVSGFETEGADPRLSTLQRYARAVGARVVIELKEVDDDD